MKRPTCKVEVRVKLTVIDHGVTGGPCKIKLLYMFCLDKYHRDEKNTHKKKTVGSQISQPYSHPLLCLILSLFLVRRYTVIDVM